MKNIKYVVFDFDGTLADTFPFLVDYLNQMAKKYSRKIDINNIKNKGLEHFIGEVKKTGMPSWKIPFFISDMKKRLNTKIQKEVVIFPYISNTIIKLKENYILGIVSSNSEENIKIFLKRNNLDKFFKFIYSDSSLFGKHKVLKKMCSKYGIQPDQVIYIGDENRDITAAKKLGIKVIAVSWGYNSKKLLRSCNPDYLIDSPEDLFRIL
jgi:phosphoglycolate phosphatase